MKSIAPWLFFVLLIPCLVALPGFAEEEPPLPAGLGQSQSSPDGPALPKGLGENSSSEPSLPTGLESSDDGPSLPPGLEGGEKTTSVDMAEEKKSWRESLPFDLNGFLEGRAGIRTRSDPYEKEESLGEGRLQLEAEKTWESLTFKVVSDFLYDPVDNRYNIDLEKGRGVIDLRQANVFWRAAPFMDIKIGRQILTWGTGDMLFINDLFPKDWNSFFIGRDTEYLKAPSDALKTSFFSDWVNLDVVYTPRFDADRFIDGRRVSYYNAGLGRRAGMDAKVRADWPDNWFDDEEWAVRLYRNFGAFETALYGYRGFWKSPGGSDPISGKATFPQLRVIGASIRGPVLGGIGNAEFGYYDSEDDQSGENPWVNNSETRWLLGYERELAPNLTGAVQYYLEYMLDHGDYRRSLPAGMPKRDQARHVMTLRLTQLAMDQNLELSFFGYFSPSDRDCYLRPSVSYKVDDRWTVSAGGNFFIGEDNHTFFGQFENNSNVYAALRYGF
jgi:hypothetical protein